MDCDNEGADLLAANQQIASQLLLAPSYLFSCCFQPMPHHYSMLLILLSLNNMTIICTIAIMVCFNRRNIIYYYLFGLESTRMYKTTISRH